MAGGRPSKYDKELHPKLAKAYAMAGLTDAQMAAEFDVALSTVSLWKTEHPEFSEALKAGKAIPDNKVEACLFKRATGYNHKAVKIFMPAGAEEPVYAPYIEHWAPDVTAQIFWLKNRRPDRWRDKQDIQVETGPLEIRVTHETEGI